MKGIPRTASGKVTRRCAQPSWQLTDAEIEEGIREGERLLRASARKLERERKARVTKRRIRAEKKAASLRERPSQRRLF